MVYVIRDKVYDNRWVMAAGVLVKFEHSLAEVPDSCLSFFADNSDFEVLEHRAEEAEASATRPAKEKAKKKGEAEG